MAKQTNIDPDTIVFTKHAKERSYERFVNEDYVISIITNPDAIYRLEDSKIKFIRKSQRANFHVICVPIPEENKWLVISVWSKGIDLTSKRPKYKKPLPRMSSYSYNKKGNYNLYSELLGMFIAAIFVIVVMMYFFIQVGR